MKLRTKLLIILLSAIVLTGVAHGLVQYFALYPRFLALERREAEKDLKRCVRTLNAEVGHLKALCHDWASWNDTYEFMQSRSQDYLDSNLAVNTLVGANLNALYFFDVQGLPIWGLGLDLETQSPMTIQILDVEKLRPEHPLFIDLASLSPGADISRSGLLKTRQGPMIAASLPILTTDNQGPARGTMIMARLVTSSALHKLRKQTYVPFDLIFPAQESGEESAAPPGALSIRPQGENALWAAMRMEDVQGRPSIQVEAILPRDILRQGGAAMRAARDGIAVAGCALLLLLLWLLAVAIVRPIAGLTRHVLNVRETGNYSARLHKGRADEIGTLEQEFDRLLETIERQSLELEKELAARKEAAQQLRENMEKYKLLAENLKDVVATISPDGFIRYCSPAIFEFSGHVPEEIVGRHVFQFLADRKERDKLVNAVLEMDRLGRSHSLEFMLQPKTGKPFPVESSAKPIMENGRLASLQCVFRDISARKRAEEEKARLEAQLQQSQKMEAIGTLAGGIAHHFNNVLFPIMGFTELAMMEIPDGGQAHNNLGEVLKAAERAKQLVQQILAFTRRGKEEPKLVRMENIVEDVLVLVRASLPSTIEIRTDFSAHGSLIHVDPVEIQSIVMNICSNAAYAMKDKGGVLELLLAEQDLTRHDLGPARKIKPGRYLKLTISDTGPGMEKALAERVFDPYFTTKPVGQGSGMGLAEAYALAGKYGGDLRVYSEPGIGSSFALYLPVLGEETSKPVARDLPRGKESVLIVDDDAQILHMTTLVLEHLGYRVTARSDGMEALETFQANPNAFDVVMTDMTMPRMTGDSLAAQILAVRPGMPIILCTGFSEKLSREQALDIGIAAYVMKPVIMAQIAKVLREVLDNR